MSVLYNKEYMMKRSESILRLYWSLLKKGITDSFGLVDTSPHILADKIAKILEDEEKSKIFLKELRKEQKSHDLKSSKEGDTSSIKTEGLELHRF